MNNNWLETVYSDSSKYFVSNPYPSSGETIKIRLRVSSDNPLKTVVLRSKEHGMEKLYEMEVVKSENGLDYYETEVTVDQSIFNYQFFLITEKKVYYYTQYRITEFVPDESRDFKILVNYRAPKWTKSTVFYQIFPDRFFNKRPDLDVKPGEYTSNGHATNVYESWDEPAKTFTEAWNVDFYNGDIYGIIEKLDYLKDFGVNAIYLNPIFTAPSSHKYDTLDFFEVDPHLGGEEAFQELMDKVHKKDMKLLLDISIDHTGIDSKWFNKDANFYPKEIGAYNNPDSEFREFYDFKEDGTYETWRGVKTMPKLNFESEKLRNILYKDDDSVIKKWLKDPYNIDGWRFDVADVMANNKDHDLYYKVWFDLFNEIKDVNDEAYVLAENMSECSSLLHGNGHDAAMNYYGFTRPVRIFLGETDFFSSGNEAIANLDVDMTAKELTDWLENALSIIPYEVALQQFNLINCHDIARIYNDETLNIDDYLAATLMLYTFPGTPNIYYGDERLLNGNYNDFLEGSRYAMDWSEIEDPLEEKVFNLHKKLNHLKTSEETLSDGGFKLTSLDKYSFSYARFSPEKTLITVVSKDTEPTVHKIDLSILGHSEDIEIKELLGKDLDYTYENNILELKVPAHGSYLIEIK